MNSVYFEAGDSGVGSTQVQSIATSQEDLHLITVSPTPLSPTSSYPASLCPASPPIIYNGGDFFDNESSQTVVE
ncbi:MAG: hypothetical protein MJE68_18130 [Proteobacteria bacterium]|nr:hypothetical protein [Pseudomonadota bacterium]